MQQWHDSLFCIGPIYQGITQQRHHQYRAPIFCTSRNRYSKGCYKDGGSIRLKPTCIIRNTVDRPTGGHARMGAVNNTGAGRAWRLPSESPSMVSRDSTQRTRMKRYSRDRSGSSRTRRSRTDKVDLSVYEIRIRDSEKFDIHPFINLFH